MLFRVVAGSLKLLLERNKKDIVKYGDSFTIIFDDSTLGIERVLMMPRCDAKPIIAGILLCKQ